MIEMTSDELLGHMRDVIRCESALRELNLVWRFIEMSARMNCPEESERLLPMMASTRAGFEALQTDLVASLVDQKIDTVSHELQTTAQNIIDVLVRNLYERTADVGFLATDRTLCEFVADTGSNREEVVSRLRAYREKYTVYEDLLLLDLDGHVLVNIGTAVPANWADEPWVMRALDASGYVESFGVTALQPGTRPSLTYSHRMLHPETGEPVGVLCLVFAFDGEMADIFSSGASKDERVVCLLLDEQSRAVASSDEGWIPRGLELPEDIPCAPAVFSLGGRQYLTQTAKAASYEGYPGPHGWRCLVMVPLAIAFAPQALARPRVAESLVQGLLTNADRFCPPLLDIVDATDNIRRVVWNGQLMTAGEKSTGSSIRTILEQITEAGDRSKEVFSRSIQDLLDAALDLRCRNAESQTGLLVELLDRNLYERSNDCRWWSMTPELRACMAAPRVEAGELGTVTAILEHINRLYTVYARLVVYGSDGCVVAASNPHLRDGGSAIGTTIEEDTLEALLKLPTFQHYHATPFRASALYDGRPTYVYHAAIRSPEDDRHIVGGIGIVFDAEPQFAAMLRGASKRPAVQSSAMFVDRSGHVISSTSVSYPIGSVVPLPQQLLTLPPGQAASHITEADGEYVCFAAAA